MNSSEVRKTFLDFFKEKNHELVKSSPLIPQNDSTLLFTNAGMIQFKDVFLGSEKTTFKYNPSTETNKEFNPQLTDGDIIIVRRNFLGKTTSFMRDFSTPIFTGIGLYGVFD